jgi:hypothetical protein
LWPLLLLLVVAAAAVVWRRRVYFVVRSKEQQWQNANGAECESIDTIAVNAILIDSHQHHQHQ